MQSTTESNSNYDNLERMSTHDLLLNINKEDKKVPIIIENSIHKISKLVDVIVSKFKKGGRLFYIGAGTSGRLGIVDSSECPPTFGVNKNLVIGIIAGGDAAIREAVEFAEDNQLLGWEDLKSYNINNDDFVLGLAASGTTPYVVGALKKCKENKISTGCIVCNINTPLASYADHPLEIIVGSEFITGSTRMKSGTAQKLILNMISTAVMIKIGKIKGNKMYDMCLSNNKLIHRGSIIISQELNIDYDEAKKILLKFGSVRKAIDNYEN